MRLAQYQVWAGREDGKAETRLGWQDRHESAYQKQKTKTVILIHL